MRPQRIIIEEDLRTRRALSGSARHRQTRGDPESTVDQDQLGKNREAIQMRGSGERIPLPAATRAPGRRRPEGLSPIHGHSDVDRHAIFDKFGWYSIQTSPGRETTPLDTDLGDTPAGRHT